MKKRLICIFAALTVMLTASAYKQPETAPRTEKQEKLHELANMARDMGLPEDNPIIKEAQRLWWSEQREMQILANVILHEAPYCTDRHQQLVAQVVLNRKESPMFPNTVEAVVNQPGQYNPVYTRNLPTWDTADEEQQRAFRNAIAAMNGEVECPENVVYQSEFDFLGSRIYEEITVDTGWFKSTTYFNYG